MTWTLAQRQRVALEHQILQNEGFTQFGVYHHASDDTYSAGGTATTSSGRNYRLYCPIPAGYPTERPSLYITDPQPLLNYHGAAISGLGVSHAMHTLEPHAVGWVQICHWRSARWHAGIVLQKVFLKALLWFEAYEQHLATGRDLADFFRTMQEAA
ncbi:hypothetical protein G6321_00054875 (plasmid) [Bradyrhizobium barranii subsp. barranii]|uniref:Uncharacterized protein n=1 Tax=Bradyrhizobium barranii subsp. barranii TaxID=2823807 RepID=A0A7Z0QMK9_9BRAD|nr:hypothetical protein [Bradyrhizobium barranii]UGX99545.1 hypothetical protein G6321_00054875 [Bradyrhizobium barranii subsp. barranii]